MKKKRSLWLLVAAVISTIYAFYIFIYYGGLVSATDGIEHETAVTLAVFIAPHLIITVIGSIFNWASFITNIRALAFVSGILYIVAFIAGIIYLPTNLFVVPSTILSFVGFAKLKEINDINNSEKVEKQAS